MVACPEFFSLVGAQGRPAGRSLRTLIITTGALLALSCADPSIPGEPVPIAARWRFADARTCDNSGVTAVAISGEGLTQSISLCSQGINSAFSFGSLPPGAHKVIFEGRSSGGMPIYRAEVSFILEAGQPKELEAVFLFEGGP